MLFVSSVNLFPSLIFLEVLLIISKGLVSLSFSHRTATLGSHYVNIGESMPRVKLWTVFNQLFYLFRSFSSFSCFVVAFQPYM